MLGSKVIFILYVCYYGTCECQGLCRTQHAPRLSEQSILNSCGRHMAHHRERQDRGERTVREGLAVASASIPSTFDFLMRSRSDDANRGSISMAVRRAVRWRRTSVMRPGPGPNSRTSSLGSTPSSAHGITRRSTGHLHSADRQTRRCSSFLLARRDVRARRGVAHQFVNEPSDRRR
jgi:hypothetical protein